MKKFNSGKAEAIAQTAHFGQFRRDGVTPYIRHCRQVAARVKSDEAKSVAMLHDVLEDTEMTSVELLNVGVPDEILRAVKDLTKHKNQPYDAYIERVKRNPLAREVKIADMISNLADKPTDKQIRKYALGLSILTEAS